MGCALYDRVGPQRADDRGRCETDQANHQPPAHLSAAERQPRRFACRISADRAGAACGAQLATASQIDDDVTDWLRTANEKVALGRRLERLRSIGNSA